MFPCSRSSSSTGILLYALLSRAKEFCPDWATEPFVRGVFVPDICDIWPAFGVDAAGVSGVLEPGVFTAVVSAVLRRRGLNFIMAALSDMFLAGFLRLIRRS